MAGTPTMPFSKPQTSITLPLCPVSLECPSNVQVLCILLGRHCHNPLPVSWSSVPCSRPSRGLAWKIVQCFWPCPVSVS